MTMDSDILGLMEYTAKDSDDIVACLQAISEWCNVSFRGITHVGDDMIISCERNPKPDGLEEANKFVDDIMERKHADTLRIVYAPKFDNRVMICN